MAAVLNLEDWISTYAMTMSTALVVRQVVLSEAADWVRNYISPCIYENVAVTAVFPSHLQLRMSGYT